MTLRSWFATILLLMLASRVRLSAQGIQVLSANPNSATQGTINLDVAVGGSGFKRGARSQFFVSGTTDTRGVTVNSTSFVSSSQVTANISVATGATLSSFDIQVTNTDGRTGNGGGLFSVTNAQSCTQAPLPGAFTPAATAMLNSGAPPSTAVSACRCGCVR